MVYTTNASKEVVEYSGHLLVGISGVGAKI